VILAILLAPLLSCSSETRFTVNEVTYLHSGDALVFRGGGCSYIQLPGSGGGDNVGPHAGDFNVTEGPDGDAFMVRVFTDADQLAEHRFDEAQLSSGNVYELSVTTHAGAVYTLKYWGGTCGVGADGAAE
jgi:hypothetical protein